MSRAKLLLDLQSVDLTRDAAVARLGKVVAAMRGTPAVAKAREELERAEQAVAVCEQSLRSQQQAREALKAHIAVEERKLYDDKVTSPREVLHLQREVEALRRQLDKLDDAALEAMLAKDAADDSRAAATAALADAKAAAERHNADLAAEKTKLAAVIRGLDVQRADVLGIIRSDDRAVYDRLRLAKAGRAVSELQGRACMTCGIELPVDEAHKAQAGAELVFCIGCGRIVHG